MEVLLNMGGVLYSESGAFFTDGNGIAQRFEPAAYNPFYDEKYVERLEFY